MVVRLSALRACPPLPQGGFVVLISVTGRIDPRAIMQQEGLGQTKNPMNLWEIEPVTLWLVA
jgi:hypothetical protein